MESALKYVKEHKQGNKQEFKELFGVDVYQNLRSADIIDSDEQHWYLTQYGAEV